MQHKTTDNLQEFTWRLKQIAGLRGFSQADIARQMKLKAPRVGNWFQGLNKPKPAERPILAALLKVDQDWLINGIGDSTDINSYLQKESVPPVVSEDQAPYGGAGLLEKEIRRNFEKLLLAAKGDVVRLGWILQQIRLHLNEPVDWTVNPPISKPGAAGRRLIKEREGKKPDKGDTNQRSG